MIPESIELCLTCFHSVDVNGGGGGGGGIGSNRLSRLTLVAKLPATSVVAADDAMAAAAAFFLCLTMLEGRVRLPYEGVSGVGIFDKFNISNVRQRP
jgi:hypothetical protein